MNFADDELVQSFIEDSREHLLHIEQDLLDLEAGDDMSLVNSVFRAAHSIKGGAGMLGFGNVKRLAHKLENVLHLVRNGELGPDHGVVNILLKGFDRLLALVEHLEHSDSMSIAEVVDPLEQLTAAEEPAAASRPASRIPLAGAGVFEVDAVSLGQARRGGNYLYLVEYDLIHDVHRQNRNPLDLFNELEKSGRVLDCMFDFQAVGSLEGEFGNSIPFYVLYASILEEEFLGPVTGLPPARIRSIESALERGEVNVSSVDAEFGPFLFLDNKGEKLLRFPKSCTADDAAHLLRALRHSDVQNHALSLDLENCREIELSCLQVLCAALRHAPDRAFFSVRGSVPGELMAKVRELGMLHSEQHCFGSLLKTYFFWGGRKKQLRRRGSVGCLCPARPEPSTPGRPGAFQSGRNPCFLRARGNGVGRQRPVRIHVPAVASAYPFWPALPEQKLRRPRYGPVLTGAPGPLPLGALPGPWLLVHQRC